MEGGGGERTEKATPKKRRDARERGQVRKSMEVVTAISMLAMFGALALLGVSMWEGMSRSMHGALSGQMFFTDSGADTGLTLATFPELFSGMLTDFLWLMLPLWGIALLSGVGANMLQFGFLFSTKALAPKMERVNPLKGIKRMFSLRTLFELVKSIAKIILIGVIAYSKYMSYADQFQYMLAPGLYVSIGAIGSMILDIGFTIGIALLILAVMDFVYQWFKYEKDLKMSKYEVKMEFKQQEGDPQIKGKIKQKQRQMAMMRMMQSVPEADVVITNPTHFAVALKYDESVSPAPRVIAKGQDIVAQRIKEIARANAVEIVENKEIARALYDICDIGMEIPLEMYQAVAEILAFVFRRKNPNG